MTKMNKAVGSLLFKKQIDDFLQNKDFYEKISQLPTIATKNSPFSPVLAVNLIAKNKKDDDEQDIDGFDYPKALYDVLESVGKGDIQNNRVLRNHIKSIQKLSKKNLQGIYFDLLYGALQFYAYYNDRYWEEIFEVLSGIAYSAGESKFGKDFYQHVDHFKCHAAIFLSCQHEEENWEDIVKIASDYLDKWGDPLPPESIMIHAAHNLSIRCVGLPESDYAYDLIKRLRKQKIDGFINEETVFQTLNKKIGFSDAHEILKILWAEILERYYLFTKKEIDEISDHSEAFEKIMRIKFYSPGKVPYTNNINIGCYPTGKTLLAFPGGSSIGKSCVLIKNNAFRLAVDFGCDPFGKAPRWTPDIDLLDTVLITHAHQDHVGGLLHLYKRFNYNKKWAALEESRELIGLLLRDYVKINNEEFKGNAVFTEKDVEHVMSKYRPIKARVEYRINDNLSFKAYPAGHIHGSCQYLIKLKSGSILVTGDFNTRECFSAKKIELPTPAEVENIKVVVTEGTYAFVNQEIKNAAEAKNELLNKLNSAKSFPILIPVLSVGRAQEVLFALSGQSYSVGVFGLAKAMTLACNFSFKSNIEFVDKRLEDIDLKEYDVLVASAGCLQGGPSKYFYNNHPFKPIYTILTGFLFPGTPAKYLSDKLDKVRYSAHSSHEDLFSYLDNFPNAKKFMVHYSGARNISQCSSFIIPKTNVEYEI